ncbi:MAG: filamentous hemagglutinin N-terminal domain-containing protein [Verrucomicrobiales bacterium]|nr:filamentous hemagglutinin N-terminal domain-containing protein [Verrucomicrobiales bacterium]
MIPGLVLFPVAIQANPAGANVVAGAVNFNGLGTSNLTINQSSNTALINWNSFSIGTGEITQFVQPSINALAINRVTGGNLSAIYGQLKANGNVMVINPAGILVGASGVIDIKGSVTLSTLDAANQDLLNGGSTLFSGTGGAGVTNYGVISGRDVIFLGNYIDNQGRITAAQSIAMGVGGEILLGQTPDGASISVRGGGAGADTGISNSGSITGGNVYLEGHGNSYNKAINNSGTVRATGFNFRGGRLTLKGGSGSRIVNTGNMYARQENGTGGEIAVSGGTVDINSGVVDASGTQGRNGGSIDVQAEDITFGENALMIADGKDGGSINLDASNTLTVGGTATSTGDTGDGGSIDLSGDIVEVQSTAMVDVSGFSGGGSARFGGGFQGSDDSIRNATSLNVEEGSLVLADGTFGDGGTVIFWSDYDTTFRGEVSAQALGMVGNGGLVEVSGKDTLTFRGVVSTLALKGRTGTLLLDPTDVTIVDGALGASAGATLTDDDVNFALQSSNVIIHTGTAGSDAGNILVDNDVRIEWGTPNTNAAAAQNFHDLTLLANGDITVEGHIISHGAGNVNLFAGWDGVTNVAGLGIPDVNFPNANQAPGRIDFAALREFGTPVEGRGIVSINHIGNDQAVQVGSRFGETNVIATDLKIEVPLGGSDRFAHLGYRATTHTESGGAGQYGLINSSVFRQGYTGGNTVGTAEAGFEVDLTGSVFDVNNNPDMANSGNINVEVERSIFLTGEPGGGDSRKYVQIGHGGSSDVRDTDLRTGGSTNQIEHSLINADHSGNIHVVAGRSQAGIIQIQAGRETSYGKIGHGGLSNPAADVTARGAGAYKGDISVINQNGSIIAFGNDENSGGWAGFTQIGHGGYRNSRTAEVTEGLATGNTNVLDYDDANGATKDDDAGNPNFDQTLGTRVLDPDLLTPDGNAVGDQGNIRVEAINGIVRFQAGNSSRSSARIGHGGHERPGNIGSFNADGTVAENADITVIGDAVLFLNTFDNDDQRMVQIGHGGYMSPGNAAGNIYVESKTGKVEFEAGGNYGFAMVGHGGHVHTWDTDNQGVSGTLSGNVTVKSAGDIIFGGGGRPDNFIATRAWKQIGHGGFGWNSQSGNADPLRNAHYGDIKVTAGGEIDFKTSIVNEIGGYQNFSLIGHGGYAARGNHYGKIDVNAETGITFESFGGWDIREDDFGADSAGGNQNFSMIGHGGYENDHTTGATGGGANEVELGGKAGTARDSSINVNTASGDIIFIAPQKDRVEATRALAEAGGGNFSNDGDEELDYLSAYAEDSFVQIGHGGTGEGRYYDPTDGYNTGGVSGDITVTAGDGKIEFVGSTIKREYSSHISLLLNGNADVYGDEGRDSFNSRQSVYNYAQIGHGGEAIRGTKSGDIVVTAQDDIFMEAGDGSRSYSMIGHGGWDSDAPTDNSTNANHAPQTNIGIVGEGNIIVNSIGGSVKMHAGDGDGTFDVSDLSWTQIGHGGRSSNGSVTDSFIEVTAGGGDLELYAGVSARENFALIGHGGRDSRAQTWGGDIDIYAENNITLISRESGYEQASAFAQIGHGGYDTDFQGNNDIPLYGLGSVVTGEINIVAATGDITLLTGVDVTSAHSGGAGNFRYEGDDPVLLTGYAGNSGTEGNVDGNTASTDFARGPDGDHGFGPDGIGWNADDDLVARADNVEQAGADGNIHTRADNIYQIDRNGDGIFTDDPDPAVDEVFIGEIPVSAGYMFGGGRGTIAERYDHDNNGSNDGVNYAGAQGGWTRIGHGGQSTNITVINQDINITAGGNIIGVAGEVRDAMVQLGHGGGPDSWSGNSTRRRTVSTGDIDITAGLNIEMYAGSGNNSAVKIGMGEYQPTADRSRVESGTNAQSGNRVATWEGDIFVKAGENIILDADETATVVLFNRDINVAGVGDIIGVNQFALQDTLINGNDMNRVLIGHLDTNDNRAGHGNLSSSGDTFIAVSRNNPDYLGGGTGYLETRVSPGNANGVVLSSGNNGFNGGLRLYMPNRPQNDIASGTVINGAQYINPGSTAVSLEGLDFRGDENLDYFEFTLDYSNGFPEGEFTPEGLYSTVNGLGGFYQVYYNNLEDAAAAADPPVEVDLVEHVGAFAYEAFDWPYGLFEWDGYESNGLWGNLGANDAIDEGAVPRSGFEAMLDAVLGPRRGTGIPGSSGGPAEGSDGSTAGLSSAEAQERIEEQERVHVFRTRATGKSQNEYFIYSPASGTYSSLRLFGVPASDLPAFEQ